MPAAPAAVSDNENWKMGDQHLFHHFGEYSLFVPFVGVFVCIVVLVVCICKGRRGKATSDIESKVLAGETSPFI